MNTAATTTSPSPGLTWQGPGASDPARRVFSWKELLWSLLFPSRRHRISITVPGLFLMALSMGIGIAAYNTASNILFITLSLLLACLLLSGLLSWFNFMGICWRVRPMGAWRAGHETLVTVEVRNRKSWLPTYGLWFDFTLQPKVSPAAMANEKEPSVREVLRALEKSTMRGQTFLRDRIDPRGEATLDWVLKPARRGEAVVELVSVGSLFPFGFLKKNIGTGLRQTVLVWPALVEYQWQNAAAPQTGASGRHTARAGGGEDLLALRKYVQDDSHRLIHWKASARLGQLMVRQFAAESPDGFVLWLETPADVWVQPEQFELLCSFVATLAEDLFAAGRLDGVIVNAGAVRIIRKVRDVEAFLDELARLEPVPLAAAVRAVPPAAFNRNLVTFAPTGVRGVLAHVDGLPAASA
jgi:uncharacterized protein (DUF58 family)